MMASDNKYFLLFSSKVGGKEWGTLPHDVVDNVVRDPKLRAQLTAAFLRPVDMNNLSLAGAHRVAEQWCRAEKLATEDAGVMFDLWWHENGNRYSFLIKQAQCMAALWQARGQLLHKKVNNGVSF